MKDKEAEVCQELCEQGGGPELGFNSLFQSFPVPNKPYGFCGREAPRKKRTMSHTESLKALYH